jgi:hypothetical protein
LTDSALLVGFDIMSLSQKAIEELKEIYRKNYNEEISDVDAEELGESLISLFKVIYRPIPQGQQESMGEDGV